MRSVCPVRALKVMIVGAYPAANGVATGGVQSAVQGLALALSRSNDIEAVLVVSMEARTDERVERPTRRLAVHRVPAQRHLAAATGQYFDVRRVRAIAADFAPDVVHGQGVGRVGAVATRLDRPCVITVHGMAHLEERQLAAGIRGRLRVAFVERIVRRTLANADALISISEYDRAALGLPRDRRSFVVPNAVRPEFFRTRGGDGDFRVVYSGLIIERKNVVGLVRAFRDVLRVVPGATLTLAGGEPDATYAARVRDAASGLGDAVRFLGPISAEEMAAELRTASCLALFSHQETLPVAIAEAMASCLPVVSSRVGGVDELVHDGSNGFLVDDGDESALVSRLVELAEDGELRQRMGKAGAQSAARFASEAVAEQTLAVYRSVLGETQ